MQVCLDSGAKRGALPETSMVDLTTALTDLMSAFQQIPYTSTEDAVLIVRSGVKSMRLFEIEWLSNYLEKFKSNMVAEIVKISDEEILQMDGDEWASYYAEKNSVQPVEIFIDAISMNMIQTKSKQRNPFYLRGYEKEYYDVDAYEFSFDIPFDGDADSLKYCPMSRIVTNFEVTKFKAPHGDTVGVFTISLVYSVQSLKQQKDMNTYVKKQFEREFSGYKMMVSYVNAEINSFNNNLRQIAKKELEKRKAKTNDLIEISKAMHIPLSLSSSAPNVRPIILKRTEKKVPQRPNLNSTEKIPSISEEDFENIVNIIHTQCTTMEDTARTFHDIQEESLRDILLSSLNTHYIDMATGETFRKNGKTDIRILFENKSAFVGECKIWHGNKKFEDAVSQLCSYATWRDTKLQLIVFNKDTKDFSSVLKKIDEWVTNNTVTNKKSASNLWKCKYRKPEEDLLVDLVVSVYDLTV